jgi:phosphatidylcholine synthase
LPPRLGQSRGPPIDTFRAFAIHIFTACGAALGFLALVLATGEQWAGMFFCLGLAVIVDGVDGPLARAFNVATLLPRWSGDTLDLVVDFVTYVFVPAYAISASGLLPDALALPAGVVVVLTGALYFADRDMKTRDNYFRGFPAVWNVIAFYLYILQPPAWIAAVSIFAFAALTFIPVKFVHPFRVTRLRALSLALLAIWAVLALIAVADNLEPGWWVRGGLSLIGIYFLGAGLLARTA